MLIWSITVIADSPQYSALVAQTAPQEVKGTALTLVTCIGFSITIGSIQLLNHIFCKSSFLSSNNSFVLLAFGAVFGLPFLLRLVKQKK
jgi:hypothetical protein